MFISHLTKILGPFHSLTLPLFCTPPDAGSGSGSSGEGSTGSGAASSGTGGSQGGAAASGSGQSGVAGRQSAGTAGQTGAVGGDQPFDFNDNARIRLSDGRVVTGAQYREELNAALDADHRSRYQRGYDLLLAEAKRLDLARRGQTNGGQQGQPRDPLAEIEQLQSVDGRTLANLYRQLEQAGLRPIAQLVSSMQQELAAMRQQMTTVGQRFGSQDEDSERERFHQTLDRTLSNIKVNGLSTPLDAKNEAIRALAENLHLSYVPGTWRAGEFEKMLGDQVNALFQYFREALKNEGNVARENLRRNFNVNRGGGAPSGGPAYKHQSPREIARAAAEAGMFSGQQT